MVREAKRNATCGASWYNGRRILWTCNNAWSKHLLYKATDRLSKWYVSGTHQGICPLHSSDPVPASQCRRTETTGHCDILLISLHLRLQFLLNPFDIIYQIQLFTLYNKTCSLRSGLME